MNRIVPLLPFIPAAGLVFQAGRQSEKIDELFTKAYAQELDQKTTRDILFDIHGKLCAVEQEIKSISAKIR